VGVGVGVLVDESLGVEEGAEVSGGVMELDGAGILMDVGRVKPPEAV